MDATLINDDLALVATKAVSTPLIYNDLFARSAIATTIATLLRHNDLLVGATEQAATPTLHDHLLATAVAATLIDDDFWHIQHKRRVRLDRFLLPYYLSVGLLSLSCSVIVMVTLLLRPLSLMTTRAYSFSSLGLQPNVGHLNFTLNITSKGCKTQLTSFYSSALTVSLNYP